MEGQPKEKKPTSLETASALDQSSKVRIQHTLPLQMKVGLV